MSPGRSWRTDRAVGPALMGSRRLLLVVALVAVTSLTGMFGSRLTPLQPQSGVLPFESGPAVPGEFVVKLRPEASLETLRIYTSALGAVELEFNEEQRVLRLRIPPGYSVAEVVRLYGGRPEVEYARPNHE